jgi:hypothetical protein
LFDILFVAFSATSNFNAVAARSGFHFHVRTSNFQPFFQRNSALGLDRMTTSENLLHGYSAHNFFGSAFDGHPVSALDHLFHLNFTLLVDVVT